MHGLRWLIFLILSIPLFSHAALRGEWESSGDMPMPYTPDYPFRYSCQVEITDHKIRRIEGRQVRVFAVGRVEFDNGNSYASAGDIQWKRVLLEVGGGEIESAGEIPFKVGKPSFSLTFVQKAAEDEVILSASGSLPVGRYLVSPEAARAVFSREDDELRVETNIYAEPSSLARSMLVVCDKKK